MTGTKISLIALHYKEIVATLKCIQNIQIFISMIIAWSGFPFVFE